MFDAEAADAASVRPLRMIALLGLAILLLSICVGAYALVAYACGKTVRGWMIILLSIWFLGGTQLLCLGVIGEYIGKNYVEVKRRPRYIIETEI